ncbi:MAG: single-stranded-DNA-specific exonuclease RecJ [Gammaproteobacteria bacterium]|nr:single-stranded-DNA-specific exonuclease RecJ [Gammaproteobacteria bacterium]
MPVGAPLVALAPAARGIRMSPASRLLCRRPAPEGEDDLPSSLHPVLWRVYRARQVRTAAELDCTLDRLLPPTQLLGMEQAVTLLERALHEQRRMLVVADFDADGATSCGVMVRALRLMGAQNVDYLVPNRFEYGYGLTPEIVTLATQKNPDVLITVDNGISSVEGVRAARGHGMQVLITDHHLPGAVLPEADAIVNPNQPGDSFPSKHLAGVGVAFYLMLALRTQLRIAGWFGAGRTEPNLANLLDLVALGTVADVVPLDANNRILVAQGLARLNGGERPVPEANAPVNDATLGALPPSPKALRHGSRRLGTPGVRALLAVAGRAPGRITATDLGFLAGPRLNAAGRLADMSLGIACLLTDNEAEAQRMARELDTLNRERRNIEADMQTQALAALENLKLDAAGLPRGLCLYDKSWHQGVIGLVAARIKERVHRPVIAFAPANDTELKGSARSVPGLHIRDALDNIAARQPQLLSKFGGHAMAAGLSLARDQFEAFARAFDEEVGRWLSDDDLRGRIYTDGELEAGDFSLELAEALRGGGPWGQGFPEPLFDGRFEVLNRRIVGEKHLKLTLRALQGRSSAARGHDSRDGGGRATPGAVAEEPGAASGDSRSIDAIAFHAAKAASDWTRIRAAYRLDVNEYQGRRSLQLVLEHIEPA